jgi:hypothetical protein
LTIQPNERPLRNPREEERRTPTTPSGQSGSLVPSGRPASQLPKRPQGEPGMGTTGIDWETVNVGLDPKKPLTPLGVPYQDWRSNVSYLEQGEENRPDDLLEQYAKIEMRRARQAGSPITEEEALRRARLRGGITAINPVSGDAYLSPGAVKNRKPVSPEELRQYVSMQYPSIAVAAQQSGLNEEELVASTNFLAAHDAASRIVATQNPLRQAQIINTMGPDMQGVVLDILENWYQRGTEARLVVEDESGGNLITDAGRTVWGYSLGPLFDGLWWANETFVQRAIPTLLYWTNARANGDNVSLSEVYAMTEKGYIDPTGIAYAKEMYGEKLTELAVEFVKAHRSGEPDAIGKIIAKYENDPEALSLIDQMLSGVVSNDPNVRGVSEYVQSMELGNFGNVMFWSVASLMGVDPFSSEGADLTQSRMYSGVRDVSNVVGTFVFDPTLGASKISGAYRMARYGVHRIAGPAKLEKSFQIPGVQKFWNNFGQSLRMIDEAPDSVIAAQRANSVRSVYSKWFTPEAISEFRKAKIYSVEDAKNYFKGADDISLMLSGQAASRRVQIPHMMTATANFKLASLKVRGLTYDRNAAAKLDNIFDAPVSQMVPEEAVPYIIERLSAPGGEKFLGQMMSDFVFADGAARRTFMGRFMDVVIRRNAADSAGMERFKTAMLRYGYKRETGVRARAERVSRTMARMPDLSSISLTSGKDAQKIRSLLLYGGMPKYWADYAADIWTQMNAAQRFQFAGGAGRSVGYALGVDVVDPVNGRRLIDEMMTGTRAGELYAANMQDLATLAGKAERTARETVKASGLTKNIGSQIRVLKREKQKILDAPKTSVTDDQVKAIDSQIKDLQNSLRAAKREAWVDEFSRLREEAPIYNPSEVAQGTGEMVTKGLYEFQMADSISLVNFNKLDELAMRQSYITAALGTNPFMSRAVDWWVIGTLAGPRFQVRNGIEDAILFGTTGGSWKGYRYGQLFSRAKAEATARAIPPSRVSRVTGRKSEDISKIDPAELGPVRGQQLGLIPSSTRWLGDKLPKALSSIVLPHLDEAEIALAAKLGAKGDRSAVNKLIMKAFVRQKLIFLKRPKNKQVISDLDDAVEYGAFPHMYDEASESGMHLVDGLLPGADNIEGAIINGQPVAVRTIGREYHSKNLYPKDPEGIRGWYNNLNMILEGDGIKGSKAVSFMTRYHKAKRSGDPDAVQKIVKEYSEWMQKNTPGILDKSGIVAAEGVESFAKRNLDDVLRVFSTQNGSLNRELLKKIRRVEVDEATGAKTVTYRMWDEVDGKIVQRITEDDLVKMKGQPQSVLVSDGIKIPITEGLPLNNRIWAAMGRSYARLTRQPMFIANYLDARQALRPLEKAMAKEFGEAAARRWAAEIGTQKALNNLLSYVDNPAIRSQLAWNLRNTARFYRAIEDFNRRMVRVAKNNPEAFQKINLGWHVLDDTGFVHEDEYGEKYFIWPGSRIAMQGLNSVVNILGGTSVSTPSLPMAFTSRVNMITPSADPNSWWPTFSSPYASFALRPLMNIVPGLKSFEEELFSEYASGTPIWQGILPINVVRVFELANSSRLGEETRSQMTDGAFPAAARAAAQAYLAAGLIDPNQRYTSTQLSEMRQHVDIAAMDILILKTVLGPIIPAAFQVQPDTVSSFARSIGATGMRQVFVQLIKAYDGDIDQAYLTWLKMNPGNSIFSVSANKAGDNIGNYQPFKETVEWIENNSAAVDQYPIGAAFFAPQEGTQNLAAWNYLRAMGAKTPKSLEQYFNELVTAEGYSMYQALKKQYDDAVAEGRKDEVQGRWDNAKRMLYAQYPNLEDRVSGSLRSYGNTGKQEYGDIIEEYRGAVQWMETNRGLDERGEDAKAAIMLYDDAVSRLSQLSDTDPGYARHQKDIRDRWIKAYSIFLERNPGDRQFETLLFTLSSSLGYRVS